MYSPTFRIEVAVYGNLGPHLLGIFRTRQDLLDRFRFLYNGLWNVGNSSVLLYASEPIGKLPGRLAILAVVLANRTQCGGIYPIGTVVVLKPTLIKDK